MLKKLFYIGLGVSIIVLRKSASYVLDMRKGTAQTESEVTADPVQRSAVKVKAEKTKKEAAQTADDLTMINGIGPTYAKRLVAANIISFADVARQTPDSLRAVSQARGQAADTESWIAQANDLLNSA